MGVVTGLAETLEVPLDASWDDIDVDAAPAYLVEICRHLAPQPSGYEAGSHGYQESNPTGDCCKGSHGGPGFCQWRSFLKQSVGESRWYQKGIEAVALGGLDDVSQILESGWTLGSKGANVRPVTVYGDEPVEFGFRAVLVSHVLSLSMGLVCRSRDVLVLTDELANPVDSLLALRKDWGGYRPDVDHLVPLFQCHIDAG